MLSASNPHIQPYSFFNFHSEQSDLITRSSDASHTDYQMWDCNQSLERDQKINLKLYNPHQPTPLLDDGDKTPPDEIDVLNCKENFKSASGDGDELSKEAHTSNNKQEGNYQTRMTRSGIKKCTDQFGTKSSSSCDPKDYAVFPTTNGRESSPSSQTKQKGVNFNKSKVPVKRRAPKVIIRDSYKKKSKINKYDGKTKFKNFSNSLNSVLSYERFLKKYSNYSNNEPFSLPFGDHKYPSDQFMKTPKYSENLVDLCELTPSFKSELISYPNIAEQIIKEPNFIKSGYGNSNEWLLNATKCDVKDAIESKENCNKTDRCTIEDIPKSVKNSSNTPIQEHLRLSHTNLPSNSNYLSPTFLSSTLASKIGSSFPVNNFEVDSLLNRNNIPYSTLGRDSSKNELTTAESISSDSQSVTNNLVSKLLLVNLLKNINSVSNGINGHDTTDDEQIESSSNKKSAGIAAEGSHDAMDTEGCFPFKYASECSIVSEDRMDSPGGQSIALLYPFCDDDDDDVSEFTDGKLRESDPICDEEEALEKMEWDIWMGQLKGESVAVDDECNKKEEENIDDILAGVREAISKMEENDAKHDFLNKNTIPHNLINLESMVEGLSDFCPEASSLNPIDSSSEYSVGKNQKLGEDNLIVSTLGWSEKTDERPISSAQMLHWSYCRMTNHLLDPTRESFKCPFCQYKSSRKGHVERHILIHSGEKPYSCEECSYKSHTKDAMTLHTRVHSGTRKFICEKCSYSTNRKAYLDRHLTLHKEGKVQTCPMCQLKNMKHLDAKDSDGQCANDDKCIDIPLSKIKDDEDDSLNIASCHCQYVKPFDKSALRKGKMSYGEDRPYPCPQCSYRATKKSLLDKHYKVHTGERPFPCPLCKYRASRKAHLLRHMRTHQKELEMSN